MTYGNPPAMLQLGLAFAAACILLEPGCTGGDGGGGLDSATSGGASGGGANCIDPAPDTISGNPEFRSVFSAELPGGGAPTAVAVGRVALPLDGSMQCCQDYALAEAGNIRIIYGAPEAGLSVFSETPDKVWSSGGASVVDVALAEMTGDNRNDLLALRSDHMLSVRVNTGDASRGYFNGRATTYSTELVVGGETLGVGETHFVVGDYNCDGFADLALPSPGEGVVLMLGNSGKFGLVASSVLEAPLYATPHRIATADVNEDGYLDILSSNDDGSFGVFLNQCNTSGGFADVANYGVFEDSPTAGMPIAVGNFCPGQNHVAVALGWEDDVRITCGDGSGSFNGVVAPHGEVDATYEFDYAWDLQYGSEPSYTVDIYDLAGYPGHNELFALAKTKPYHGDLGLRLMQLAPGVECGIDDRPGTALAEAWSVGDYSAAEVHGVNPTDPTWSRLVLAGDAGIGVLK